MDTYSKMVYFDIYCEKCKYSGLDETKDPCNECLEIREREGTHVPEYWEGKNENRS